MKFFLGVVAVAVLAGCHDPSGTPPKPAPAPGSGSSTVIAAGSGSSVGSDAGSGSAAEDTYVPAEFKAGTSRFKDIGVYVDGKPAGFLSFGELPIALKPTWRKHKANAEKPIDCKDCKIWKWEEQRYYRFTEYLHAIGIEPKTIKEIQVQGPKETNTIVATGKELGEPKAEDFMFHFGGSVRGKAIPHVPLNFGNGRDPDKITAVMIYINKTPPTFDDDGFVLDGRPVDGIPYFGEPLRGGVRVYLDDKLAAIIKRQDLDYKHASVGSDGEQSWLLWDFFKSRGVDTSKVVEGWVIRNERRQEHFPVAELSKMTFEAPSKSGKSSSGAVLLGDQKIVANVIALHTHTIKPEELPAVRPDEENN
jgi:hypothetical protein